MVIAKTASRNVAFKVARMRDAIMQDQDAEFITRNANFEDVVSCFGSQRHQGYFGGFRKTILKFRRLSSTASNFEAPSHLCLS